MRIRNHGTVIVCPNAKSNDPVFKPRNFKFEDSYIEVMVGVITVHKRSDDPDTESAPVASFSADWFFAYIQEYEKYVENPPNISNEPLLPPAHF